MSISQHLAVISPARLAPGYTVGVEVGAGLIRAGVFAEGTRLLGKTKISTKLERGFESVIGRIVQCIRYAVDECDLELEQIQAVGVGVPAWVDSDQGIVRTSPELGWKDLPLARPLEQQLDLPVAIGNLDSLGAYGIFHRELLAAPRQLAVVFIGPNITGAFLQNGQWLDFASVENAHDLLELPLLNIFRTCPDSPFEHFRSRDFRKELRKRNQAAYQFLLERAEVAGAVVADLARRFQPEIIVVGGLSEEVRDAVLERVRTAAFGAGVETQKTTLVASTLADLAGLTGAAAWAAHAAVPTRQPEVCLHLPAAAAST